MIPHSRPTFGEEEKRACCAVLDSLQLAQGKKVEEFEKAFCVFTGRRYAVAVSSGTSAFYLSLLALGISKSDEIIIPSYNCAALLHPVVGLGAAPVFADIEIDDFNISARDATGKIRKKTRAVVVPHLFGRAADMEAFERLGIPVIEDGTQALGVSVGKKKVGTFGLMSIFSFYATKMITTGEGGIILTDSKKLADTLRDLRDYDKKETFRLRTNSKMTEIQAAMGIEQLKKLPFFIERRRQIAGQYDQNLRGLGFMLPQEGNRDHVYYRYVVRIPKKLKALMKNLETGGVEAKRPVFKPLHRYFNHADTLFPATIRAMSEACSLPIFPSLTVEECGHVCQIMQSARTQSDFNQVVLCKGI